MKKYDVIILGAGAAGLKAASILRSRKKSVLIIDMGAKPARKIEISGGGNCNFTNLNADYTHYFGKNPQFVRSALNQWTPTDTLNWVKSHNIKFIEKEPGRFFCANGTDDIINAMIHDIGTTEIKYNTNITDVEKNDNIFITKTNHGDFYSLSLIIATGGISYPHLGVSNIGHIIAKKFGHKIEPIRPALCAIKTNAFNGGNLAGISTRVAIKNTQINDDLLFTHFGIGGPATYRATVYLDSDITIDFVPGIDILQLFKETKKSNGKKSVVGIIEKLVPNKLARFLCNNDTRNVADVRDSELSSISNKIKNFTITDWSAVGMQSAEITFGGISVDKISSKTMESKICNDLYFAGEVLDISGDLGGYNIQWALSSGYTAGLNA